MKKLKIKAKILLNFLTVIIIAVTFSLSACNKENIDNSNIETVISEKSNPESNINEKMYIFTPSAETLGSYGQLVAIKSLQGIVNREGPILYINIEKSQYPYINTDAKWLEIMKNDGYKFEEITGLVQLYQTFEKHFKGIIVLSDYIKTIDGWRSADADFISMVSSITDYVPVQKNILSLVTGSTNLKTPEVIKAGELELPGDMSNYFFDLELDTPHQIYQFAFENLLQTGLLNQGNMMALVSHSMDYAVQNRMFFATMHPNSNEMEKILLEKIYEHMFEDGKIWSYYGWVEEEESGMRLIAKHGGAIKCVSDSNLSFLGKMPGPGEFKQKASTGSLAYDPSKIYITFMASENDTIKAVHSFQHGAWLDSQRGNIPINWGIPGYVAEDFPYMAKYFYETATENDYFFSGGSSTSGFTYINSDMPFEAIDQYADDIKKHMKNTDQKFLDFYTDYGDSPYNPVIISQYLINGGVYNFISRLGTGMDYGGIWDNQVFYYNRGINMYPKRQRDPAIRKGTLIKENDNRYFSKRNENYWYISATFNNIPTESFGVEVFTQENGDGYKMEIQGSNAKLSVIKNGSEKILAEKAVNFKAFENRIVAVADSSSPMDRGTGVKFYINNTTIAEIEDNTYKNGGYALFSEDDNVDKIFTNLTGTHISQPGQIAQSILKDRRKFIVGFYGYIFDKFYENNQMMTEPGFGPYDVITLSPTDLVRVVEILEYYNPGVYEVVNLEEFMKYAREYYQENNSITIK